MDRREDSKGQVVKDYQYFLGSTYSSVVDFNNKESSVKYYANMMLNRCQSIFEYKNLPDTIPQRSLELYIQTKGNCCIAKVNGELYALTGGFGGVPNEYYMPTIYIVANPYLKLSKSFKVDEDCVVIPNDSMYMGLMPMFNRYATLLAENDISLRLAGINSRIMALINAKDDRAFQSAKNFFDDIEKGKLGVVASPQFLEGINVEQYGGNSSGLITQLIELQQYLKASWFNDLGLDANYNMKREAINSSEAQMNDDALLPFIDDMLRCRKIAIEKVNKMFGTNIQVELTSSWKEIQNELETLDDPDVMEEEVVEEEEDKQDEISGID